MHLSLPKSLKQAGIPAATMFVLKTGSDLAILNKAPADVVEGNLLLFCALWIFAGVVVWAASRMTG